MMVSTDDPDRWLHELTVDDAARRRTERSDQEHLRAESSSLADLLGDLAARGLRVVIHAAGTSVTGAVSGIGVDYVEIANPDGHTVVSLAALSSVEQTAGAGPALVDRSSTDLAEWLRLRSGEGRPMNFGLLDGRWLGGRLASVGPDALTVDRRPDLGPIHIRLQSLALVSGYR
jgi:hypothetical protein